MVIDQVLLSDISLDHTPIVNNSCLNPCMQSLESRSTITLLCINLKPRLVLVCCIEFKWVFPQSWTVSVFALGEDCLLQFNDGELCFTKRSS